MASQPFTSERLQPPSLARGQPLSSGPFWNHHRSANVCFSCFLAYLDSILSLCLPTYFSPSLLAALWRFWLMAQRLLHSTVMLRDGNCFSQGTGAAPGAFCASHSFTSNMPWNGRAPLPCYQHCLYFNCPRTWRGLSKGSGRTIGR